MSIVDHKVFNGTSQNTVNRCYNCGPRSHQSKECPDWAKGAKCFACQSFGYRSFECPNKESIKNEKTSVSSSRDTHAYQISTADINKRIVKEVCVSGIQTTALIDTKCDLNLCHCSFQAVMGIKKSVKSAVMLGGSAGVTFWTKQQFTASLEVNCCVYTVEVYSLPDETIICNFIIGRPLFQNNAELRISLCLVEINKICSDILQVMAIEIDSHEMDIAFKEYSTTIRDMMRYYILNATQTTPMRWSACLSTTKTFSSQRKNCR